MDLKVHTTPLDMTLYGCAGTANDLRYAQTAFACSEQMWEIVKARKLNNKGINIWVYGPNDAVYAGVEMEDENQDFSGLQQMRLHLPQYAYYKHVGSYGQIPVIGQRIRAELAERGLRVVLPHVEIYGHWTPDETKLETELLYAVQ